MDITKTSPGKSGGFAGLPDPINVRGWQAYLLKGGSLAVGRLTKQVRV